ncbi:MAG: hypothetical protein N4A74_23100 [Carboxylicivirga sp.]|nr:hypothetical protein [Carboxylicivirga sp.]
MQNICLRSLILHICILSPLMLFAQNNKKFINDSTNNKAFSIYNHTFDNPLTYINGREYKPYHYPKNPNPYLHHSNGTGCIYIDGKKYDEKQLKYDMNTDELIVIPDYFKFSNVYIQINKAIVDSFTIEFDKLAYSFIQINKENKKPGLADGFYQPIYKSNKTELLLKHYTVTSLTEGVTDYKHETKRYLFHSGYYQDITTKRKLLSLFPSNKKDIKKEMRTYFTSYKNLNFEQLANLIQFIDSL